MEDSTRKYASRKLLLLLLIIAGIEQNPGPWTCPPCTKNITRAHYSVQCTCCLSWLHLKCSQLKSLRARKALKQWKGPCCTPLPPPPPSSTPSPPSSPSTTPPTHHQQQPASSEQELNICQVNINGIKSKNTELMHLMTTENIHVYMHPTHQRKALVIKRQKHEICRRLKIIEWL